MPQSQPGALERGVQARLAGGGRLADRLADRLARVHRTVAERLLGAES